MKRSSRRARLRQDDDREESRPSGHPGTMRESARPEPQPTAVSATLRDASADADTSSIQDQRLTSLRLHAAIDAGSGAQKGLPNYCTTCCTIPDAGG